MKHLLIVVFSIGLACMLGCADDSEEDNSPISGENPESGNGLDWHTSSCSELGGEVTPLGACLISCSSTTCPTTQTDCILAPGLTNICEVPSCSTDTDCGPEGWYCRGGYCNLTCTTLSGGAQSSECPVGWECYAPDYGDDQRPYYAYGVSSGSSCGNCGTDNAGGCCGGLFCSGACIGSPCC